jgi:hypothetical protein
MIYLSGNDSILVYYVSACAVAPIANGFVSKCFPFFYL